MSIEWKNLDHEGSLKVPVVKRWRRRYIHYDQLAHNAVRGSSAFILSPSGRPGKMKLDRAGGSNGSSKSLTVSLLDDPEVDVDTVSDGTHSSS